jgi:hypothetical protein
MNDAATTYRLRVLTRCRVGPLRLLPGQELVVAAERLRVAAWLCRVGSARPLDDETRIDVELHLALAEVLPR